MNSQLPIKTNQSCLAELKSGDCWIRLIVSLAEEYTGGELVRLGDQAHYSVEGADELARTYTRGNWMSGVASGGLYAFRALKIPRRHVRLAEFAGRLRASDMEAVALATALAVAKLADKPLPAVDTNGWDIHLKALERPSTTASQQNHGDRVATG